MTVPITSDYKKPEDKLVKFNAEGVHCTGRPGWGDGKSQCFFYHLELCACENTRCYYVPRPASGSVCTGYVNCPIYQHIMKEYHADKVAQEKADQEKRQQRAWNGPNR